MGKANYDGVATEQQIESDMSGLAYGLQVGTIYEITKNVEFEFGVAYTKYNVDKSYSGVDRINYEGFTFDINYNGNFELKDSRSMFAGINYKF